MLRVARLALAVTLGCAAAAFAGDPAKPPKATKGVPKLPKSFLAPERFVRDLAPGESSLIAAWSIRFAPDGAGWVDPASKLMSSDRGNGLVLPKIVRRADRSLDVDITDIDVVWPLSLFDGTTFVPEKHHVRIANFVDGTSKPTGVLPEKCRGEWLWSLPPGTVGYVAPDRVGVDVRGEAWIHCHWAVRLEPFAGSAGPALAVTALDRRDAVKLDLSGVRFRWIWSDFPEAESLDPQRMNGHHQTPFVVTSFTVDGRVTTRMPPQLMAPKVKDLKKGDSGFVDGWSVRVFADGRAFVDADAAIEGGGALDGWDYAKVAVRRVDEETVAVDLAGTTRRWAVAFRRKRPESVNEHDTNPGRGWLKVGEVRDGAEECGAVMPPRCIADALSEVEAGATVYASCRYIAVDGDLAGFISTSAPVANEPFADELGPAVAIQVEDEEHCAIDVSGVTYRWETEATPRIRKMEDSRGRYLSHLKVVEFIVPDIPEPPKPPPKKPPTKKK